MDFDFHKWREAEYIFPVRDLICWGTYLILGGWVRVCSILVPKEFTLQRFKDLYTGSGPGTPPKNAGDVYTLSVLGPVGWLPRVLEAPKP